MDGVTDRVERAERRITVTGRVQGVGFRWFARDIATRLGVAGWAINAPDGSVVIEASGPAGAVDAFVERLRAGPPHAHVTHAVVGPRETDGALPDPFAILR